MRPYYGPETATNFCSSPPRDPEADRGPLLATAVCAGPVSGGGAVAGTLALGTASQPVQFIARIIELLDQQPDGSKLVQIRDSLIKKRRKNADLLNDASTTIDSCELQIHVFMSISYVQVLS